MTDHTLQQQMFRSGTFLAALAVALGAFGAHELKATLRPEDLATFETGVRYQFIHAIAIIFFGLNLRRLNNSTARNAWYLLLTGITIFSGSLYLLATRMLTLKAKLLWVGGLTPIGGMCLIGAWVLLMYSGYKETQPGENSRARKFYMKRSETEGVVEGELETHKTHNTPR